MDRKTNSELTKSAQALITEALGDTLKDNQNHFMTTESIYTMSRYLEYNILPFTPGKETEHVLGAIYYKNKRIYINDAKSNKEKLFILCHEVCHAYLHNKDNLPDHLDYSIKNKKYDVKESEANVMSYEILMPKETFNKTYISLNKDLDKISNFFGVTIERVLKRLIFLDRNS